MESPRFSHSGSPAGLGHGDETRRDSVANKEINPYWESLDSKSIPAFLAEFFENGDSKALYDDHVPCLFEVLAKADGHGIVSQIKYMMSAIIQALQSSSVLDSQHDACAKLVSGIARFGIQPLMTEDEKREIVYSLYQPLSNCVLGTQGGLVYGSALCMEALVNSANWRFASDEIVNDVCLKVAVALEEKPTQTKAHMSLVMALAKHNSLRLEPYARVLMRSGLQVLRTGVEDDDSQKQLSTIQMMNLLMNSVDPRSVFSELEMVIKELENCYSDQIQYVKDACFEAIQTARTIIHKQWSTHDQLPSTTDSKSVRRSSCRYKTAHCTGNISHSSSSPASQYVYSVCVCDVWAESLYSTNQHRPKFDFSGSSVKRKLLKEVDRSFANCCNGYMDFNGSGSETDSKPSDDGEIKESEIDKMTFSRFGHATPRHGSNGSTASSSGRSQSNFDADGNEENITTQKEMYCCHCDQVSKGSSGSFDVSYGEKSGLKSTTEYQSVKHRGSVKVGLMLVFGFSMILLAFIFSHVWIDDQPGLHIFPT